MSPKQAVDKDQAQARIDELVRDLNEHAYRYYVLDSPIISDAQYDELFRELSELEAENPEFVREDSPTQRVGDQVAAAFTALPHAEPMLSLANARNLDELRKWYDRMVRRIEDERAFRFVTEPKIDGLAISLTYENGRLVRGLTRGNGIVGEDVTSNLKTIRAIPLSMRFDNGDRPPGMIEVRGEVYMPVTAFEQLNEQRIERGEPVYMNPRNSAAGTIRQLDPRVTASRQLSIFIYGVGSMSDDISFDSHSGALDWLRERGFPTSPDVCTHDDIGDVADRCAWWEARRHDLNFEIDGVVVKVDDRSTQRDLGTVGREPRWAVAFKFAPTTMTTHLRDIGINVGRTGALTPFAILDPVEVGGVTVRMANLHNAEDIARKDIRVGDTVIVQRAGDVIPQVVGPVVDARSGKERKFRAPKKCPACDSPVERSEVEVVLRCPNPMCPAKSRRGLEHFVSRGAMDIEGMGEKNAIRLYEEGLVKTPADIYRLTIDEVLELEGFQQRSAEKLIESIERSKERPVDRLIYGLGIRHVGDRTARDLALHFGSLQRLADATVDEIMQVPGVGEVVADSVAQWFADDANYDLVHELAELGLQTQLADDEVPRTEGPLAGKAVVLTGTFPTLSRAEAEALVEQAGGRPTGSVSRKTDYVVVGENPGSKFEKAQKAGVPIIDEAELLRLAGRSK